MAAAGRVKLTMWEGGALWLIEAAAGLGEMDLHAHHAIQITCLLAGRQTLSWEEGSSAASVVAVGADARHRLELEGRGAILFADPESATGRAIAARFFASRPVVPLAAGTLDADNEALDRAWADNVSEDALRSIGRAMLGRLADAAPPPALPDPRVSQILAELERRLEDARGIADCAGGIHLSESRLRHLFAEQTGLPFKSYILWRRLGRAVEHYAGGASLTEAAHEAGFADSAHFSRTFRRTFGLPATTLERT